MPAAEKKWLVLSSNTVLGPYTQSEIENLLEQSVISIHDKVTEPYTFWWDLQDHPNFKNFIQTISIKDRIVNFVTGVSGKMSQVTAKTMPISDEQTSTLEVKIKPKYRQLAQQTNKKPEDVLPQGAHQVRDISSKARTRVFMNLGFGLVILLCVSILGYIVSKEFFAEDPLADTQATFVKKPRKGQALKFYKDKNYKQAFKLLQAGFSAGHLSTKEKLLLASLHIQNNRTDKARNILESLDVEKVRDNVDFLLVEGLINLYSNNFQTARQFFSKAKQGRFATAKMNLAILDFLEGNHSRSLEHVQDLIRRGFERGIVFYLKVLNEMKLGISDVKKDIQFFLNKTPEFHQEYHFLLGYLNYFISKDTQGTRSSIEKVLSSDPYFAREYHYDSFLARNLVDWQVLMEYCSALFTQATKDIMFKTLEAFCLLQTGQRAQAYPLIKAIQNRIPKQALVLSLEARYLMQTSQLEKASSVLSSALENNPKKHVLPYILQARVYEFREEWKQALNLWQEALTLDPRNISALSGVAFSASKLSLYKLAETHKKQSLKIYPHHSKALDIQLAR